jgi:hypothetical protein
MKSDGQQARDEVAELLEAARSKRCRATNRAGEPCGNWALTGQDVCRMHGGKSPQALAKAAERLSALRDLALETLFTRIAEEGRDIDPKLLLDAIHKLGGQVELLEGRATTRSETVTEQQAAEVRDRLVAAVDDLADRRAAREAKIGDTG